MKTFFISILLLFCFRGFSQQQKNSDFAEYAKQLQKNQSAKTNTDETLPKKDISKHVSSIAVTDKAAILRLSDALLAAAKKMLNPIQQKKLDDVIKELANDSTIVNEAMMLYAAGAKEDASVYLVSSVIKHNVDAWFVNNLGVLLKDGGDYVKAIQLFQFADKNLKAPSPIVKTNLGWASAYYGDFESAKKFFNAALSLVPEHDGALEGLCHLAFAEGDYKALIDNLYKRIKITGAGGGKNINQFQAPGLIDDVLDAYEKNESLKKPDPREIHLFDNDEPQDNVYNPGGAPDVQPSLDMLTGWFSSDALHLYKEKDEILAAIKQMRTGLTNEVFGLESEFKALPPWKKEPYKNETGEWIYPYNYESELKMFKRITKEFNKRDIWTNKDRELDKIKFTQSLGDNFGNSYQNFANTILATDPDKREERICSFAIPNYAVVNDRVSGYFSFWSKWHTKVMDNVNWYIAAASPYIRRVHQPQLNEYLNHERAVMVKCIVVGEYLNWLEYALAATGVIDLLIVREECLKEPPKSEMRGGDEVMTPKLKKLKTYPEPCVVPTGDFDYDDAPAGIIMTCDELKLRFGYKKKLAPGASASAALHLDFKFGENEKQDEVKIYLQGGIKGGVTKDLSIDGHNVGEIGAQGGLKGTAFIEFKGNKINYGVEGGADAKVSLGGKSEEDGMKDGEKDIAKQIDKYLPGAEMKTGGSVLWTAETGPKVKMNGVKLSTSNIPGN